MPADVAIIGAGPAGLATAAGLRARGISYRLFDRTGLPGGAYREIYAPLQLASPTKFTVLPGLAHEHRGEYITASQYRDYLDRYATHHELVVERADVRRVARAGGHFEVELARDGDVVPARVRAVVVATGMWTSPRVVSVGGTLAIPYLHARDWRGPDQLPAGDLVVIGGGTSAVEIAEEAARAGRRVHVVARSGLRLARQRVLGRDLHDLLPLVEWIPVWAARGFCARPPTLPAFDLGFKQLRKQGKIVVHTGALRVEGERVVLDDGTAIAAAAMVSATGYQFDTPFVPAEVERAPGGHLRAKHNESVSWRNLFVVGAPCAAGLASEFLRGIAKDAEAVAAMLATRLQGRRPAISDEVRT